MEVRLDLGSIPEVQAAARAGTVLRRGGIALLPAEGVYGFHVLATADEAVARLRAFKGSEARSGFIGLLASLEELARWAEVDPVALGLVRAHWPGPLTLVLPALPSVPPSLRTPDGTVALRCPGSTLLRMCVERAGGVLLSTSANRPGEPAAVCASEAPHGIADLTVDAGPLSGIASTIAGVERGAVRVLRQGALSLGGGPS